MSTSRPLLKRINNRLGSIYNNSLRKLGYGNRILAPVWDEQYANGRWAYLDEEEEAAHYQVISRFYAKYTPSGSSLDIGCGHGLLYKHMNAQPAFNSEAYVGIDISGVAIEQALSIHPDVDFRVIDFDKERMPDSFDAIIFNESIYYFQSTSATIKKCIQQNLKKGGVFIISIYDHPDHIHVSQKLNKLFVTLEQETVANDRGQKWRVSVLRPL